MRNQIVVEEIIFVSISRIARMKSWVEARERLDVDDEEGEQGGGWDIEEEEGRRKTDCYIEREILR